MSPIAVTVMMGACSVGGSHLKQSTCVFWMGLNRRRDMCGFLKSHLIDLDWKV